MVLNTIKIIIYSISNPLIFQVSILESYLALVLFLVIDFCFLMFVHCMCTAAFLCIDFQLKEVG